MAVKTRRGPDSKPVQGPFPNGASGKLLDGQGRCCFWGLALLWERPMAAILTETTVAAMGRSHSASSDNRERLRYSIPARLIAR